MNDLLKKTQELCRIYDIKPQSSMGQNFLVSLEVYKKIVASANIKKDEVVLEVGPGLGFLSAELLKSARKVIAVELDDKLAKVLELALSAHSVDNLEIINENILDFDPSILEADYKIVANLPYNISSVFLRKFLTTKNKPKSLTLMLQKEVVERIVAEPGKHSLLSLSVQYYSQAKYIDTIKKENFWPQPKVDSAILHLETKEDKEISLSKEEQKTFFRLLKFGFSAKRKKLVNNLAGALQVDNEVIETKMQAVDIDISIRAQGLSLNDWQKLFAQLRLFMV
ncbi:MAG TPA: 16S rRNA (adenine(1518)-N(6)/adenine(1519)-N(6))-dimethyltransferase RsmA [Patescibacteria group bacterium]|nr:16S rRNA (adenine(1518)-N(6)/adenine(1519)-N(6))-dimethyltransferase RsmA [Patescibacteria group bacterium]